MSHASPDVSAHVAEFKELGYTVLPGVYDEPEMAKWRAKFQALTDEGVGGSQGAKKMAPYWFGDMLEHAPGLMLPAVTKPAILDTLEAVMGPFLQLDNLTLVGFPSGPKDGPPGIGWHRDRYSGVPRGGEFQRPLAVNAIAYLQDLTDEFGPLRVIPRSHRTPIALTPEERGKQHPQEKVIHMKAGDAVLVHNGLLHSGTANRSGKTRYFFSIYYNLCWLRHTDNHKGPNTQSILRAARARNDRRVMRLLGEDELLEKRCNSGFVRPEEETWPVWIQEDREAIKPEA